MNYKILSSSLTFKKRNRYLLLGLFVMILVCYNFAVKGTITLINGVSEMKQQASLANDAPARINDLQKQLTKIESEIGNTHNDSNSIQQVVLSLITNYCLKNNIVLQEFPKPITNQEKDILIETDYFVVEGDFIKLLLLVNQLEHHKEIGKVTSTHFQSKKNVKTKKTELVVTIYIQNLKKISI